MRPLITAEPMLRAGKPEMLAESNFTACCAARLVDRATNAKNQFNPFRHARAVQKVAVTISSGPLIWKTAKKSLRESQTLLWAAGILKKESSMGTFASILS